MVNFIIKKLWNWCFYWITFTLWEIVFQIVNIRKNYWFVMNYSDQRLRCSEPSSVKIGWETTQNLVAKMQHVAWTIRTTKNLRKLHNFAHAQSPVTAWIIRTQLPFQMRHNCDPFLLQLFTSAEYRFNVKSLADTTLTFVAFTTSLCCDGRGGWWLFEEKK